MTLLVLGGTGTLGRQVVIKALNEGFQVKCFVRSLRRASFLKEWGAELIYGDLILPETIPLALIGVSAVIDCSTSRATESHETKLIDLKAKYILLDSAIKAGVKRFIFFSIIEASSYPKIALLRLKSMVELRIKKSSMKYTIFYLPGFFQGLIPQYALPILDKQSIWITDELSSISYINTQDVANLVIQSLSIDQFTNKSLPLIGKKAWTSMEVIKLCERISGRRARINRVPLYLLNSLKQFMKFFQWSWNIAERLDFIQVLSKNYNTDAKMQEILYILKIDQKNLESLEFYFQEYFARIMKKLKELNYQSLNNNTNIDKIDF